MPTENDEIGIDVERLKQHNFFKDWVKTADAVELESLSELSTKCKGEEITFAKLLKFAQKATSKKCLYLIETGSYTIHFPTEYAVKVDYHDEQRKYFFGVRSYKHELFGEFHLADEYSFSDVKATCMSKQGSVISIPIRQLKEFLVKNPTIWKRFFESEVEKILSLRLYTEAIQLTSRGYYSPCVAASILAMSEDFGKDLIQIFEDDFLAYISEKNGTNVFDKKLKPLEAKGAIKVTEFALRKKSESEEDFEIVEVNKNLIKEVRERGRIFWKIEVLDKNILRNVAKVPYKRKKK